VRFCTSAEKTDSDITYVATLEGRLYLAVILDLFSRRVVGWKLGQTLEPELVVTALRNASRVRQIGGGSVGRSVAGWSKWHL
jgi:putative transposase